MLEVEAVDAVEAVPELAVLGAADGADGEVVLPEASDDCAGVELLSVPAPSPPAVELSESLALLCASPGAPLA